MLIPVRASSGKPMVWAIPILAEAAALGRSVVFAWVLGPDELGQAMILALTVRLAEMASDVGVDRLMLQAGDGGTPHFQSNMHGVVIARGLIAALVLLAAAPILAAVFDGGPSVSAYAWLAAVPALRGMVHLDFRRSERLFRYKPMALVEGGATAAMIICVLPAAVFLADHRAMPAVLIAHAAIYAGLSHLVAIRPYDVRFSASAFLRVWRFGAPLVSNAVLLFITFYADRIIVSKAYDWATLAVYGVALQLALLPAQITGRAAASLVLPRLRVAIRRNALAQSWQPVLSLYILLAAAMAAGFVLLAPAGIAFIYGTGFRPDPALTLALGAAAGFRILRTPYSQLAIAIGRTGDPARANLVRALALIPAAVFAAAGLPLAAIAAAAALGEAGAMVRAYFLARPTFSTPFKQEISL
ncbi:MAG: oligosaccharide flippase family protein [Pelagimonas sp.]|jgi:O-antigen/teichoic acid export membrane protein|nr:oligosaccharide flippase family protein [Pelagimonas sp.]